jgi:hypothetical protein
VLRGLVSRLDLASQRSAAVRASLVRQGHAYWSMVSQGNRTPIDFAPPEVLPGLERVLARAA